MQRLLNNVELHTTGRYEILKISQAVTTEIPSPVYLVSIDSG